MSTEFDFFSERARRDPFPIYSALRDRAPVHYDEAHDAWVISRYEDVVSVINQPDLFSSRPASFETLLLGGDPPAHARIRKIVGRALPHATALEKRIRTLMQQLITPIRDKKGCDLIEELATPLPLLLITELMGLDHDRYLDFKRWSDAIVEGEIAMNGTDEERRIALEAIAECDEFFRSHVSTVGDGRDDIVSRLLFGNDPRSRLNAEEAAILSKLLLVAGNETTVNLIGNCVLALLRYPETVDRLRSDKGLMAQFVEEVLRFDSPVQITQRITTTEVSVRGQALPSDARVMVLLGSANRDPAQFPNPDVFDIDRQPRTHLAFGMGTHICLGAPLARLEARVALEALLEELPDLASVDPLDTLEYRRSFQIRGLQQLELRFAPTR